MGCSPYREANNSSAGHEMTRLQGFRRFITLFTRASLQPVTWSLKYFDLKRIEWTNCATPSSFLISTCRLVLFRQWNQGGCGELDSWIIWSYVREERWLQNFAGETSSVTKMTVFWHVVPCRLVEVCRRFRGACCLHHQGDRPVS
jgi:hypothetical protein